MTDLILEQPCGSELEATKPLGYCPQKIKVERFLLDALKLVDC